MKTSETVPPKFVKALVMFTVAQALIIALLAYALTHVVWTDAESVRAVRVSAWIAVVVQIFTFAIARLVAREQVIAGWGIGVLLRFATVAAWGAFGVDALGLPSGPALMSLVGFYFVSTLIEPLFLNT